jgi:hypothetical protein
MSDSAVQRLRELLPEPLRSRLPDVGTVDAWFETLGDDLPRAWVQLEPSEFEDVVRLLLEVGSESALPLRRAEELAPTKAARKLARRAIHRLKSRGVAVEPSEHPPKPSVLRPLAQEQEQGIVTPPDPLGQRRAFLIVPVRGAARMYEIGLSDVDGVVYLESFEGKRRDARAFERNLREQEGVRAVVVDASALRALVARAAGHQQAQVDRHLLAELLRGSDGSTPGEGLRAELEPRARELSDRAADQLVRGCIEAGELPPWPPVGDQAEALAAQIEAIEHSPLVLTDVQKRERRWELFREYADRVLDRPYRERVAERLEESAVFLLDEGNREAAVAAVQVGRRVREAANPLEVPFMELMLTLFLNAAQQRRDKADPTRLIVPR